MTEGPQLSAPPKGGTYLTPEVRQALQRLQLAEQFDEIEDAYKIVERAAESPPWAESVYFLSICVPLWLVGFLVRYFLPINTPTYALTLIIPIAISWGVVSIVRPRWLVEKSLLRQAMKRWDAEASRRISERMR